MASAKRTKLHYTLCESALPENMGADHFGEFYIAKAEQSVWFVARNGTVVSLSDFLLNAVPVAPPRRGKDGKDAEPAPKGERGPVGPAGKDAPPAKDGRDAVGIQGPQGIPGSSGCNGKDAPQRVEFDNLLRENKALHSEFASLRQDFNTLSLALTSQNQKTSDYLAFLRQRVAQRLKDKQQ
jgi:hypothetical protein